MNIGENIKKRRLKLSITQEELAKQVDITEGMLSQIERGVKVPSLRVSRDIAKILGCTIDELLEEEKSWGEARNEAR